MLKFLVSQKLYLTSLFWSLFTFVLSCLSFSVLPALMGNQHGLVLRYHLVILSRFEHFPDYQMKTNFWRNQLQWTLTTTVYNELYQLNNYKPTPKDWKWFKYAQNNQKNQRTKECCNGWLLKNKIASSKQQKTIWTVEWLMIAKFIVVEGSHLLPVSKILNIFSK